MPISCPFEKIYPSQLKQDDTFFMKLAYNQAIEAWQNDEVPIGAVIVHEKRVIAAAYNRVEQTKDPTAHAEMLAITKASYAQKDWRLSGSTLYVTKEPCPMCSGAAIMSRLSRVVYALPDPKQGCLGGSVDLNITLGFHHKLVIEKGILHQECQKILQAFFAKKRQKQDHECAIEAQDAQFNSSY